MRQVNKINQAGSMNQETHAGTLMSQLKNHYQLVEEPFSERAAFFFEDAQRRHNLETIKHLAAFGDLVLFLTGEKGAGKSFLLKSLQAESNDILRTCYIDCDHVLQGSHGRQIQIIQHCLAFVGLPLQEEAFEDACRRLLVECTQYQQSDSRRTLFIFDCADKLPRQQLQALCGFCRQLPDESSLVMLFSGSGAVMQNSRLGANLDQDAWWHQIQLKPLMGAEVQNYLAQAMEAAGYQGLFELSEQQLEQLVQIGKGLPGRINKIFASIILEPGQLKLPSLKSNRTVSIRVMSVLVVLLVCSFLFVAFQHGLFERFKPVFTLELSDSVGEKEVVKQSAVKDPSNTALERTERLARLDAEIERQGLSLSEQVSLKEGSGQNEKQGNLPVPSESSLIDRKSNQPIEPVAEITQEDLKGAVDQANDIMQEVAPEKASTTGHAPTPKSPLPESEKDSPEKTENRLVVAKVEQDAGKSAIVYEKSVVKPENPVIESTRHGAFRSRNWLETQPATAYLPQILGSFEEQTALIFIEELGKQKYDIYYLETEHKGRPWFVVFYGVFPDKKLAQGAIRSAPERIQRQQPWLRRADSVLNSYPD
jgi:septal ring-binding cell division protein DamX/type II secretory pathway predicted ATPase ExeA